MSNIDVNSIKKFLETNRDSLPENLITKLESLIENNFENYDKNILYKDLFNYNDLEDLFKYRNVRVSLSDIFNTFTITDEKIVRYKNPPMSMNYTTHELNTRRKLYTLNHKKNELKISRGETLSRIYTNKNLSHISYSTKKQGFSTNLNNRNFERVGNSLIYKGQQLNKTSRQKLSTNNGGGIFLFNPNHPIVGIKKKYTQNEIRKHPLSKNRLSIL